MRDPHSSSHLRPFFAKQNGGFLSLIWKFSWHVLETKKDTTKSISTTTTTTIIKGTAIVEFRLHVLRIIILARSNL